MTTDCKDLVRCSRVLRVECLTATGTVALPSVLFYMALAAFSVVTVQLRRCRSISIKP